MRYAKSQSAGQLNCRLSCFRPNVFAAREFECLALAEECERQALKPAQSVMRDEGIHHYRAEHDDDRQKVDFFAHDFARFALVMLRFLRLAS